MAGGLSVVWRVQHNNYKNNPAIFNSMHYAHFLLIEIEVACLVQFKKARVAVCLISGGVIAAKKAHCVLRVACSVLRLLAAAQFIAPRFPITPPPLFFILLRLWISPNQRSLREARPQLILSPTST